MVKPQRVFVHRSSDPKAPKFSIHDVASGVVTERDELWLCDAIFEVAPAGWLRRVRENQRVIHAGVFGTLLSGAPRGACCNCQVCYRANEAASFLDDEHRPIHEAGVVHLVDGKVYVRKDDALALIRWDRLS